MVQRKKAEKYEENGAISGTHISWTTMPTFFKFGMLGCVYGGHKIRKFDRNQPSGYRDISSCK